MTVLTEAKQTVNPHSVGNLGFSYNNRPKNCAQGLGYKAHTLNISKVSNQTSISLLYIMLEIHNSGREPSI